MNGSLINTELFQIIHEYLGNPLHETELCIVLQVLVGNLDIIYELGEVECILALLIEKQIYIEFVVVYGVVVTVYNICIFTGIQSFVYQLGSKLRLLDYEVPKFNVVTQ
jgi:hypothetical protein